MSTHLRHFWRDEAGFVLSAELVLISTICVIGLVAGLSCVRDALVAELNDVGAAFRNVQQSYAYSGMHGCRTRCGTSSWVAGSAYFDGTDVAVEQVRDFGCFDGVVERRVESAGTPCVPAPQLPAVESECPPPALPCCPPAVFNPCPSTPVPIPAPSFGANSPWGAPCDCGSRLVQPQTTAPCQLCSDSTALVLHGMTRERYFWEGPGYGGRTLIPTNLVW